MRLTGRIGQNLADIGECVAGNCARDETGAKAAKGKGNQYQCNERCSIWLGLPAYASARADSHGELSIQWCVKMT